MRKAASFLTLITLFAVSCKTADDQVPQIAADFCNCFTPMEKDMSKTTVGIITAASAASNPETALQSELEKLPEEDKMKVASELISLSKLEDETSDVGRCMKAVEKKYDKAYTFNEKKFTEKVIKELDSKNGCNFTAAIMKLGMKMQESEKK